MAIQHAISSIGILLGLSILGGIVARRFNQPAAIGLLLLGMIFGPNVLNIVNDAHMLEFSIEIGATLLLFVIGLEFDLTKLKKVWVKSLLIALLKFGTVVFLAYEASAFVLGLDPSTALILGVLIAFTSTVVVVKILEDKGMIDREEIPLLLGILVFEDLIGVILLTFMTTLNGNIGFLGFIDGASSLILSLAILVIIFVIALISLRPLVDFLLRTGNHDDVINYLALVICAGFSYLAYALGVSSLTGAFLGGSLVATLPNSKHFHEAIRPYTLTFSSFFFIAIGTLINPAVVIQHKMLILGLLAIVLISRFIGVGFISYLFATLQGESAFFSSLAMISVGEFSLLIANAIPNPTIDLVTISAVLIAFSAILMSIGVGMHSSLYAGFGRAVPESFKERFEKFSDYVHNFTEQLGHETTASKHFRKEIARLAKSFVIALLVLAVLYRLAILLESVQLRWFFIGILATVAFVLGKNLIKAAIAARQTFVAVLTALDYSRNFTRSRKIMNCLLQFAAATMALISFPLVAYLLNLNWHFHYIPLLLLIIVAIQINRIVRLTSSFSSRCYMSMPEFKKIHVGASHGR